MRGVPFTALAALLLALSAMASAPAAASDGRILRATPTGSGRYPVVAADTGGRTALAWLEQSGKGLALRTATVSTAGRLAGRRQVARSPRRSDLAVLGIGIDARGRQHLLFSQRARGKRAQLLVTRRSGDGAWARPQPLGGVAVGGLLDTRTEAVLVTSAAGDSTAVWCLGGQADNMNDFSDPGTLYTAKLRRGATRWSRPQALWRGQFCSFPQLAQNAGGDLLASWYAEPAELDYPPMVSIRRARGGWSARHALDGSSRWLGGTPGLRLGDDRSLLFGAAGITTDTGIVARTGTYGRTGNVGPLATLGRAPAAATSGGWVGAGDPGWASAPVGSAANSTVLVRRDRRYRPDGGADLPALWSATGTGASRQELKVDDLAEATDSPDTLSPDLTADVNGRPVATWAVGAGSPCTVAFYRSTLMGEAGWTRRALVATQSGSASYCDVDRIDVVGNGSLITVEGDRGRTDVWHAAPVNGAAAAPTIELLTTSWSAIRSAGAIELRCTAVGARLCTVSLVPALQDATAAQALEPWCRPTVASGVVAANGVATIRFPIAKDCYKSAPAPPLPAAPVDVSVLGVADALGRTSTPAAFSARIAP